MRWHRVLLQEIPAFAGMTSWGVAFAGMAILLMVSSAHAADVPRWNVIPDKSSIEFVVSNGSGQVTGRFGRFTADIAFDPEQLEQSHIKAVVDMTSLESDDSDALGELPSGEWLDVSHYPQATYESSNIKPFDGGKYIARGTLTLRGQAVQLLLPFSLLINGTQAVADGEVSLKRTAFSIGAGNRLIGDDVTIRLHVEAVKE